MWRTARESSWPRLRQVYFELKDVWFTLCLNPEFFVEAWYHLQQRLSETQSKLETELNGYVTSYQESISYSESSSTNPTVLSVRARTKLFFLALYLAVDVDRYFRLVYLVCHFALIPKTMQNQLIHDKLNAVRSITEEASKFRHTGANRDDFASNNAGAAIERHGFVLADEFLSGDKRSTLAPEITTRPELDEQAKKAIEFATKQVTNDPLSPSTSINQPPRKAVDQVEKAETLNPETTPTSNAQLTTSVTEQPTNNTPQQPSEGAQEGLNPSREIEAQQTEKVGEYSEQPMQND